MTTPVEQRVVDNRVFLLGLDELYREAMKPHERGELLDCARDVAQVLDVAPATVPIEGYYGGQPADAVLPPPTRAPGAADRP